MYFVLTIIAQLVSRMSDRTIDRIARSLTWLLFDVLKLRRGLVMKNVSTALGRERSQATLKSIARKCYYNTALTFLEVLRSYRGNIAEHIEVRGREHVERALAQGKGLYIVCSHMGNWEAMGAAATQKVVPVHAVVKRVGSPGVDRFVNDLRRKNRFLTIERKRRGDAFRAMKEVLAKNEAVGFVMDQTRPGAPKLPFFGVPAKTNTSLAFFMTRLPAPVISATIRRVGISRHVLEFMPELTLFKTDNVEDDVRVNSMVFNQAVEEIIRRSPEQYFWFHNRWKD